METRILDGKKIAEQIRQEVAVELAQLRERGVTPGLAVVLVGENPASRVYVRNKSRTCEELGMYSRKLEHPAETTTEELLRVVDELNHAQEIDGILVQLPLPPQVDQARILQAVDPAKDVDAFHPVNVGRLCEGKFTLAPCTPMGIMALLRIEGIPLKGKEAVVVGRSDIVGKPMAFLLLHQHATVTICHSRTQDLPGVCRRADILVAAIGRPAMLTADFIKPGAVVIDVGINRVEDKALLERLFGTGSARAAQADRQGFALVGDVHPLDPLGIAAAVTPVPGGVGPLTIAQLMKNTVLACRARRAL
jgi:methylenetetrahydrofolate dehydrogenase (NADP+)/methenyltetrahydrofolate cyclohydrolase